MSILKEVEHLMNEARRDELHLGERQFRAMNALCLVAEQALDEGLRFSDARTRKSFVDALTLWKEIR